MVKDNLKKIAKERITRLFELAKEESKNNGRSKRYVTLARKISEKYKVRLPREAKRIFCRKCNVYFSSKSLRVRTKKKEKRVIYTCLDCGHVQRYPYIKEKFIILKEKLKKA